MIRSYARLKTIKGKRASGGGIQTSNRVDESSKSANPDSETVPSCGQKPARFAEFRLIAAIFKLPETTQISLKTSTKPYKSSNYPEKACLSDGTGA